LTPMQCLHLVASEFGLTSEQLIAKGRRECVSIPRQMAMALLRERFNLSYQAIGEVLKRDHGTVMNGCKRIANLPKVCKERARLDLLRARIKEAEVFVMDEGVHGKPLLLRDADTNEVVGGTVLNLSTDKTFCLLELADKTKWYPTARWEILDILPVRNGKSL
jgi:hypothetical protein